MARRPSGGQGPHSGRHKRPTKPVKRPSNGVPSSKAGERQEKLAKERWQKREEAVKKKKKSKRKPTKVDAEPILGIWREIDRFIETGEEPAMPKLKEFRQTNPRFFDLLVEGRKEMLKEAGKYVSEKWNPPKGSPLYNLIMEKPEVAKQLLKKVIADAFHKEMGTRFDAEAPRMPNAPKQAVSEAKLGRYMIERFYRRLYDHLNTFRQQELSTRRKEREEKEKGKPKAE